MVKQSRFAVGISAVLLIVTMGLLTACGGGQPSIVGYWNLKSISGEDGYDEATIAGLADEGMSISLEATEDGKVTLDFFGEINEGTWSAKDDSYTLDLLSGEAKATVKGDEMTVDDGEDELVFKRGVKPEEPASGKKEDSDNEDPVEEESAVVEGPAIVGLWKLTDMTGDDEVTSEDIAMLEEYDMAITFEAAEDGNATLDFMGDALTGTWTESAGKFTITMDGESVEAKLDGDTLKFESDGTSLVFKRSDGAPSPSDATEDDAAASTGSGEYPSFGEKVDLPSGIELTVDGPKKYKLSGEWLEESYPPDAGTLLAFDVVVKNGTSDELDAWNITQRVVSDGQEAAEVYDASGGVSIPSATILPGKSLKYKVAFQVADPDDIQFTWEMYSTDDGKVHYLSD